MKTATIHMVGTAPYSQSRPYEGFTPKLDKERPDDYEERTWRERIHANDDGEVYIPQIAIKNCIAEAAKYLSIQIPGKGKATFTKHFEAGIVPVGGDCLLGIQKDEVEGEPLYLNADGRRGGSTRVWRTMPKIPVGWKATCQFAIIDNVITEEIFKEVAEQAGMLIGIGRWRPRNNGLYGRFDVDKIVWN